MSGYSLSRITEQLTERDYTLIADVTRYRLATTRQIQRLHFDHRHPSRVAAARACSRNLTRLRDLGILKTLERRVGGARAGSAGLVWYLGPAGERIQNARENRTGRARRNYREPSPHFVEHTLAITDVAVTIHELARDHPARFELLELQTEPTSWQTSLTRYGTTHTLKPDLRLVTAAGDYEHHWFLEVDRDTEHLPVIARQCAAYETHRATGRYQSERDIYPTVVWIVPTTRRRTTIQNRIHADPKLDDRLFIVITGDQLPQLLLDEPDGSEVRGPADEPDTPTQKEGDQP